MVATFVPAEEIDHALLLPIPSYNQTIEITTSTQSEGSTK